MPIVADDTSGLPIGGELRPGGLAQLVAVRGIPRAKTVEQETVSGGEAPGPRKRTEHCGMERRKAEDVVVVVAVSGEVGITGIGSHRRTAVGGPGLGNVLQGLPRAAGLGLVVPRSVAHPVVGRVLGAAEGEANLQAVTRTAQRRHVEISLRAGKALELQTPEKGPHCSVSEAGELHPGPETNALVRVIIDDGEPADLETAGGGSSARAEAATTSPASAISPSAPDSECGVVTAADVPPGCAAPWGTLGQAPLCTPLTRVCNELHALEALGPWTRRHGTCSRLGPVGEGWRRAQA